MINVGVGDRISFFTGKTQHTGLVIDVNGDFIVAQRKDGSYFNNLVIDYNKIKVLKTAAECAAEELIKKQNEAEYALKVAKFESDQQAELENVHPVLASAIRELAYENGHSSGYTSVLNYVRDYVYTFSKVNELLKGK